MVHGVVWGIVGVSILLMLLRPRGVGEVSWRVAWRATGKAVDCLLVFGGDDVAVGLGARVRVFDPALVAIERIFPYISIAWTLTSW